MKSLQAPAVNMGSVMIEQNGEIKSISQRGKVELGKQVSHAKTHSQDGLLRNRKASQHWVSKSYLNQFEIMHI